MYSIEKLLIDNIDLWSSAESIKGSGRGRASATSIHFYGIEKLRELILQLAVSGKLLDQCVTDVPASNLLNDAETYISRMESKGRKRKQNSFKDVGSGEIRFALPRGWKSVRLGQLGDWGAGATPLRSTSSFYGGGIPWFKSGELSQDFISASEETVTELALEKCSLRINKPGDVLLAMYGATIGKASILEVSATTNQAVCACSPYPGVSSRFLLLLLKAMRTNFISQGAGGAQPNISREKIIATPAAIPPIEEQERIIVAVDELMLLCDKLQSESIEATLSHELLVKNFLSALIKSDSHKLFDASRQRIFTSFEVLFKTPNSIKVLKHSLLELALMGKLTSQRRDEESADELLKQIEDEKNSLIFSGSIKKDKPPPLISEDEKIFPLPPGWQWARLQTVIDVRDGTHDSPKESMDANSFPLVTSKDFSEGEINFDEAKRISAADHEEISKRSFVEKFDILFSMIGGNIGNQVMVTTDQPFSIKNVALFKYYNRELTNPFFIKKYSEYLASKLQSSAVGGAQPFVSLGQLRALVIALPPKQEQIRIVEKLDQLLLLCDKLEMYLKEANQLKKKIADVLVEQALT